MSKTANETGVKEVEAGKAEHFISSGSVLWYLQHWKTKLVSCLFYFLHDTSKKKFVILYSFYGCGLFKTVLDGRTRRVFLAVSATYPLKRAQMGLIGLSWLHKHTHRKSEISDKTIKHIID